MWKWMVVFLLGVMALTMFLEYRLRSVTQEIEVQGVPVAGGASAVGSTQAPGVVGGEGVMPLSVSQERLMNRVPPVNEGPVKGEILLQ